jgi:hypothetical protein
MRLLRVWLARAHSSVCTCWAIRTTPCAPEPSSLWAHARTRHSIVSFYYRQPSSFVCVPEHSLCQRARRPATAAAPRRAVRRPAGRRPEFSESDKAAHNRGLCVPNLGAVDPVLAVRRVHPPARVVDPARREVRPAARRLRALRGRALRLRGGGRHAAEHRAGAQ